MVHAKRPGSTNDAGVHIGTVDRLEDGQYIKLTKADSPDDRHRWFPIDWVESVDDKAVYLNKTEAEAIAGMLNEPPSQAMQDASPTTDPATGAGVD
ncbi:DUF2171 domain-containing protein [Leptolyngbya sp. NK1-12]|nr:DUF2171 domain-containing protein [Leptolyngbya sp. NK1-12]